MDTSLLDLLEEARYLERNIQQIPFVVHASIEHHDDGSRRGSLFSDKDVEASLLQHVVAPGRLDSEENIALRLSNQEFRADNPSFEPDVAPVAQTHSFENHDSESGRLDIKLLQDRLEFLQVENRKLETKCSRLEEETKQIPQLQAEKNDMRMKLDQFEREMKQTSPNNMKPSEGEGGLPNVNKQQTEMQDLHSKLLNAQKEVENYKAELEKCNQLNAQQLSAYFFQETMTVEEVELLSNIKSQIDFCIMRNDDAEIKRVFDSQKPKMVKSTTDKEIAVLCKEKLKSALDKLGRPVDEASLEDIFKVYDQDGNGSVSFEEFKFSVRRRSKLEQWSSSLPVSDLVASCFAPFVLRSSSHQHERVETTADEADEGSGPGGVVDSNSISVEPFAETADKPGASKSSFDPLSDMDPLAKVRHVGPRELTVVCMGLIDGCHRILKQGIEKLDKAYQALDEQNLKSSQESDSSVCKFAFSMKGGKIADFYNGLEARIGHPNLNFMKAMQLEHSSKEKFKTPNYDIETCPLNEWRIVITCDTNAEAEYGEGAERHKRRIPDWRQIVTKEQLTFRDQMKDLALTDVEAIAIILYTGPMFVHYNTVLRRWPDELYKQLKSHDITYTSTIYCLVSGVTKVSRRTKIPAGLVLYRGFGGAKLPDQFYKAPGDGYKGYVEWGFMSTTSDKKVAVQYTGIASGRLYPTLLEIQPAAVDHGADISQYSQFQHEVEFLWNPCSLVEGQENESIEATENGIISKICVRMNNNVKTQTVEELRELKKTLHLNSFKYIMNEIKSDLEALIQARYVAARADLDLSIAKENFSGSSEAEDNRTPVNILRDEIFKDCQKRFDKHKETNPDDFVLDETYRWLVREMMETKPMAISKLRLWLEDSSQLWSEVKEMPLRIAHRTLIGFLESGLEGAGEEKPQASYELCKMKNLITASIDEVNELEEPVLIQVCAEGADLQTLKLLVDAGADINAKDKNGWSAVMKASFGGHTETVNALMSFVPAPGIDEKNQDGETAVLLAAQKGHATTVRLLLDKTADIGHADNKNSTALMKAALFGHKDIVSILLDKESDLIKKIDQNNATCIMMAAEGGHTQLVRDLQERAGNCTPSIPIDHTDIEGRTALFPAAMGGYSETVKALHSLNANIHHRDQGDRTAIMLAAFNGKTDTVKLLNTLHQQSLIEAKSNPSEEQKLQAIRDVDKQGLSCIVYAAKNGKIETVKELIALKADITTSLHSLCKVIPKEGEDVLIRAVSVLIDCRADINTPSCETNLTPLEMSSNSKVRLILQKKEADKWTPILTAAEHGKLEVVQELKERKNDKNDHCETALHIASYNGHTQIVKFLIDEAADVNTKDRFGRTPLHMAAANGSVQSVRALILAKAIVNAKDVKELSPLAFSKRDGEVTKDKWDSTKIELCSYILKLMGAEGWTPLMVAAEQGTRQVELYLKIRDVILRKRLDADMPQWFKEDSDFCSSLKLMPSRWTWGAYESSRGQLDTEKLVFSKISDSPAEACVLGSQVLGGGVHMWALKVENVNTMWVGIARGVEEKKGLAVRPNETGQYCDSIIAFDVQGGVIFNTKSICVQNVLSIGFCSGQTISFELDTFQKTLKFKVENMLAAVVYDINETDYRPYVCVYKSEVVNLVYRSSFVKTIEGERSTTNQVTSMPQEHGEGHALYLGIPRLMSLLTGENVLGVLTEHVYRGADINMKNEDGNSALHIAAGLGRADLVKVLLDANAELDGYASGQVSCLHAAAKSCDPDTLLVLLNAKANVDAKDKSQQTALHVASSSVKEKAEKAVRLLLMFKANPNAKDDCDAKPLKLSKHYGTYNALKQMDDNWTPLMIAISDRGGMERIESLIREGDDVNSMNNKGQAAVHVAAQLGHCQAIKCLLTATGAIQSNDQIKAISLTDKTNQTALHYAAAAGEAKALLFLIDARADVNAKDKDGRSVLKIARDFQCQNILKKAGADGWTAVMVASERGKLKSFFHLRDCIRSMENNSQFPQSFANDINFYFDLSFRPSLWIWENKGSLGAELSDDGETITKTSGGGGGTIPLPMATQSFWMEFIFGKLNSIT